MHLSNKSNCFEYDLFPLAGYSIWVHTDINIYLSIHSQRALKLQHSIQCECECECALYMVRVISGGNSARNARSNDWNVNCIHFAWISNDAYAACARKFTFVCQPLDVSIVLPPGHAARQPAVPMCVSVYPCVHEYVCERLLLLPPHLLNICDCRPKCGIII